MKFSTPLLCPRPFSQFSIQLTSQQKAQVGPSSQLEVRFQMDLSLERSLHPSWQPGSHIYDSVSTTQVRPPDGPLWPSLAQDTLTFPQASPEPYLSHPSLPTSESPPGAIFLFHLHVNAASNTHTHTQCNLKHF